MTAILTDSFRAEAATSLFDYISNPDNAIYMYLGNVSKWPNSGDTPVDPENNLVNTSVIHYDMIMCKRLLSGNTTMCANRYNWEFGTTYDQYDTSDVELNSENKRYYVITAEYNVYKCLNNNFAAASTKEPIGTSIEPFTLDDGYTWKYMFTIAKPVAEVFMNGQFMPVKQTALPTEGQWMVQATATPGAIESYIVRNKGSGYTTATVEIIGDGEGAIGIPIINSGQIVGIQVGSKGNGYTWATAVITGTGVGAAVDPQVAPPGGHGSNPVYELGANYVMAQMTFDQETYENVPEIFSFRKLGLLSSPKYKDGSQFTDFVGTGCHKIYSTSISGFGRGDTLVFDNELTAYVIEVGSDFDGSYLIVNEVTSIEVGMNFYKRGDSGTTGSVLSMIIPDLIPNSWRPLYTEHRSQITKNSNQLEYVRVVIEF